MSSKRQKEAGWLLPEQITGHELICVCFRIPNDERYIAAFRGAVGQLAKWYNWEKSYVPGDNRATTAATYWRQLIREYLEVTDCGGISAFDAQSYFTNSQILQNEVLENFDGVDLTTVDPDAPSPAENFNYTGTVVENAALCAAAQSYVSGIISDFAIKAKIALGLGAALPVLGLIFGPLGAMAGGVVYGALAYATTVAINATNDLDAINEVICCMFEGLKDTLAQQSNFAASLDNCGFEAGSNAAILRDIVAADLGNPANFGMFGNAIVQGLTAMNAGAPDTCPNCDECVSYDFDWSTLPDIGDWQVATLADFPANSIWNGNPNQQGYTFNLQTGAIRGGGYNTNDFSTGGVLEIATNGCHLTMVAVTGNAANVVGSAGFNIGAYRNGAWEFAGGYNTGPAGWIGGTARHQVNMNLTDVTKVAIIFNAPQHTNIIRIEIQAS